MSIIGPRPQTQRCFDAFPKDLQPIILKTRPGLSGIGSIIFRNEEDMMDDAADADEIYNSQIMPYKGTLEKWYVENNNIFIYFILILLTVWVVLTGKANRVYKIFPNLPRPPENLVSYILGSSPRD